jgi:hypothetical protein
MNTYCTKLKELRPQKITRTSEWLPMIQFYKHDYEPAGSTTAINYLKKFLHQVLFTLLHDLRHSLKVEDGVI